MIQTNFFRVLLTNQKGFFFLACFILLEFGTKAEKAEAKEMLEAMGFWNDEIPEILNLDSSIESSKES